jgi:hypothetical protein
VVNGKATAELCLIQDTAKCRGSLCRLDEPRTGKELRAWVSGKEKEREREREKKRRKKERKKENKK